jgi:dipeptidyl aminopeptidase/acylaminoacyl peptidase
MTARVRTSARRRLLILVAAAGALCGLPTAPAAAVPAGANGQIACRVSASSSPATIQLLDAAGGPMRPLPSYGPGEPFEYSPSWAPDGRRLAYAYGSPRGGDVMAVDTLTGARWSVTQTPGAYEEHPAWSPDGSRVAYVSRSSDGAADATIWVSDPWGNGSRPIAPGQDPAWSPDGRRLAFSRGDEIYTMSAGGGDVRRLTYDADADEAPSWSPDGDRLIWLSGWGEVWIGNAADGRATRRLTDAWSGPVWSPDGTHIAVARGNPHWDFNEIWALSLVTGEQRLVGGACAEPDWQRLNRLPSAGIAFAPDPPVAGQTLRLRSTSSDPDGPLAALAWDVDGDGFDDGTGETASRTLAAGERSVTVRLRARDADGAEATATQTITVGNRRPVAGFTVPVGVQRAGTPLTLTSTATDPDGDLAEISWDLDGDGAFDDARGPVATVTFPAPGRFAIRQQVTDREGAADTAAGSVDIEAPVPPCPAGGAREACTPPPPDDRDGDGTRDSADACPAIPGPPEHRGCPLPLPPVAPQPPAGLVPQAAPPASPPASTPTPSAVPAPRATLRLTLPRVVAVRGREVPIRLTCATACRGTLRVQTRRGGRARVAGVPAARRDDDAPRAAPAPGAAAGASWPGRAHGRRHAAPGLHDRQHPAGVHPPVG